jgi:hypothetical protein
MSAAENKLLARRVYDAINWQDLDVLETLFAPNIVRLRDRGNRIDHLLDAAFSRCFFGGGLTHHFHERDRCRNFGRLFVALARLFVKFGIFVAWELIVGHCRGTLYCL